MKCWFALEKVGKTLSMLDARQNSHYNCTAANKQWQASYLSSLDGITREYMPTLFLVAETVSIQWG